MSNCTVKRNYKSLEVKSVSISVEEIEEAKRKFLASGGKVHVVEKPVKARKAAINKNQSNEE